MELVVQIKHEDLRIWKESMSVSERIYTISAVFPKREDFGLTSQLRRAAVSILTNIAEGCGRYHTREYIHFLYLARGSLFELFTLLALSLRLTYLSQKDHDSLREQCEGLLAGLMALIRNLERRLKY